MRSSRTSALAAGSAALVLLSCTANPPAPAPLREPDVVFVATPRPVVDAMLELAGVGKGDVVYDLGCGDGRIPIAAVRRGARRAVCVDIDPRRLAEARENARDAGVEERVELVEGDLFETDLAEATVVTLYLLPALNLRLKPRLLALRPGTRIVSHQFDMGDWAPDQEGSLRGSKIYLWTVPEGGGARARTAR